MMRIAIAWMGMLLLAAGGNAWGQRTPFSDYYNDEGLVPIVRVAQAPGVSFDGGIQPAPLQMPGFDPYSSHTTLQPPSLLPQTQVGAQGYSYPAYPNSTYTTGPQASSPNGSYLFVRPDGQVTYLPRVMQSVRGRYTWINGNGNDDLEMNIAEAEATFLFPFFGCPAPLLFTPGGAINWTAGPLSPSDVPSRLYDLYGDIGWRPHITQFIYADLGARIGYYTDFENLGSDALRYQFRAYGGFNYSPTLEVKMGVVYLDRVRIKMLPAGGLIWTPDDSTRWEILFPNPKLAMRLTQYGTADIWGYVAGEYGGDSWAVERDFGLEDQMDYNDIRVILGLEWSTARGLKGMVEAGYLFERELVYRSGLGNRDLNSTFMLRGGLQF